MSDADSWQPGWLTDAKTRVAVREAATAARIERREAWLAAQQASSWGRMKLSMRILKTVPFWPSMAIYLGAGAMVCASGGAFDPLPRLIDDFRAATFDDRPLPCAPELAILEKGATRQGRSVLDMEGSPEAAVYEACRASLPQS